MTPQASGPGAVTRRRQVLRGWGRTPASVADVYTPGDGEDLRAVVSATAGTPALARGLGRSYGDASLNAGGTVIDMTGLDGIGTVDRQRGTLSVDAGVSFDALIQALMPQGYFVPVTPGTRFVTVGGAIAADVHGKNHHADGSIQQHLERFDLLLADGQCVTVSPVSDPDAFRATAGGLGLTGAVTRATLRLLPVETAYMAVTRERTRDLATTLDRFRASDQDFRYSVAWVDCMVGGRALGRSVLMQANHASLDEISAGRQARPLDLSSPFPVTWPRWMPSNLVHPAAVRVFNEALFRRAPAMPRQSIEGIVRYFYPLDRIRDWNRAYGPRGFVQYQFVVPDGAEATLEAAIAMLYETGCPSPFAVLKRMGPGAGMLSFPMAGWTLALDIQAGAPGLAATLDAIDGMVAEAGGRVYLAKDARMRPESVAAMYPELDRWKAVRRRLDPDGCWQSDLARRLGLV